MSRLERHEAIKGAARCGDNLALLRSVLEGHIIPSLVAQQRAEALALPEVDALAAERLAALACAGDVDGARAIIDARRDGSVSTSTLVSACARLLGQAWEADARTFVEVTVALGVLSRLVTPDVSEASVGRGHVLLTTAPGEQHQLGLLLVAQSLRRDGWFVEVEPGLEPSVLAQRVAQTPLDAVGFTVSRVVLLPALASSIDSIWSARRARPPAVMVGGCVPLTAFAAEHHVTALASPDEAVTWLRSRLQVRSASR
ncbi:MAG: hypothetical protein SFW67_29595 [Myxococcaceae bacterium]|nr:hypothetical protein [Myxococcaceae bacterium]